MLQLTPDQTGDVRYWFLPDRPGPLIGLHVVQTGHGTCFVDRWPAPRAVLVGSGFSYALVGEPDVLGPGDLQAHLAVGSVDAAERFEPLLRATFPAVTPWARVISSLPIGRERFDLPPVVDASVRLLGPSDASAIACLDPELAWISRSWGGPVGLAASAHAWGAFTDSQLLAVACSFFVGEHYEDVGVVTTAAHRGRGLSAACATALCRDIQNRGRQPSWTTTPDNAPSLRVAEKLGFTLQRHDRLLLVGQPPVSAAAQS
jgi:GNAT superfamily N-acetyltransferase